MTATLAAVLVEQSVISWDTMPLDVWPQHAATMHPQYQSATIVDLLSHQSGLPVDIESVPSLDSVFDDAPGTVIEKRRLWAKELLEQSPANPIGEFRYSNAGYIVVGAMLETITGAPWETLMTDQLFGPLGMSNTGFGAPGSPDTLDQPWGHWEQDGALVSIQPGSPSADNPQAIGPAGNVHTTLSDFAMYLFAHIDGERGISGLVTAETFQFLHRPVRDIPYGLGWDIDNSQGWTNGPAFFHFGSNNRWISIAVLIPGLDAGVLMVTNIGTRESVDGIDELVEVIATRIQNSQ